MDSLQIIIYPDNHYMKMVSGNKFCLISAYREYNFSLLFNEQLLEI